MKIALINMPFITVRHSSPALSLFKKLLKNKNVDSDVLYLNIDFFNAINNLSIHEFLNKNTCHGDWLASRSAFGELSQDDEYFSKHKMVPKTRLLLISLRQFYESFIEKKISDGEIDDYDIYAFCTNMGQNIAAIGAAKLIKNKFPHKKIYLGGYGVFGEIGVETLEKTPWIDAVFWHNSDFTFVDAMCRSKETTNIEEIMADLGSTAFRNNSGKIISNFRTNFIDQNNIDIPDFSDYINKKINDCYIKDSKKSCNIEFSRGCYYGESVVCTFCSEPGLKMKTKPKSFDNALKYLQDLENEYPECEYFTIGDSLLPQGYIENVFKPWKSLKKFNASYFVELKPYVNPLQIKILKDSGVDTIQPGIESFHPEILKLTKKGHKVHHGISFLNFCKFFGVKAKWNYLLLVPLEKPEWYEEQVLILEHLKHLIPPMSVSRITITKFTPYSDNPSEYGIELSPDPLYALMYPKKYDLMKLCWNYDNKYKIHAGVGLVIDSVSDWMSNPQRRLEFIDEHSIIDTRYNENKIIKLNNEQIKIIRFCLYPRSYNVIKRNFDNLDYNLRFLSENRLVLNSENRVVSYVSVPEDYTIKDFEEEKNLIQIGVTI